MSQRGLLYFSGRELLNKATQSYQKYFFPQEATNRRLNMLPLLLLLHLLDFFFVQNELTLLHRD